MTNVLSVIDTLGIQPYIFGSNRLGEQIGASYLVGQVTGAWATAICARHGCKIIVSGGGNLLYHSETLAQARAVAEDLSSRVLTDAPGIDLAAAHCEYGDNEPIGGADGVYNRLFIELTQQKQRRLPLIAHENFGVALECISSGDPAAGWAPRLDDDTLRTASVAILKKLAQRDTANDAVRDLLSTEARTNYTLSNDFDNLGRSAGEQSYIAVVHADGNGMGQRFRMLVESTIYALAEQNKACIDAICDLSQRIEAAGKQALKHTLDHFLTVIDREVRERVNAASTLSRFAHALSKDGRATLPFRPLVFGGDDVTFVCDGRIGLPLAAIYLQEFERAARDLPGGPGYACAGVAIVKVHYPFARAYALAEELCKSAKRALLQEDKSGSALDWHIAQSGLSGGLEEIRTREYEVKAGQLCQRPVTLGQATALMPPWRTWEQFSKTVAAFNGPCWAGRRNKLIALRDELRGGPGVVERYRQDFGLPLLPTLTSADTNTSTNGWDGKFCGYFDAIEALDYLLSLEVSQ